MFSFKARKKQLDVSRFLNRIIDLTADPMPPEIAEGRLDKRYGRSLPVLCTPWQDDEPQVEASVLGRTKNLSNKGFGLHLNDPWEGEQMLVGFFVEGKAQFVLGKVCATAPDGGCQTHVGLEIAQVIEPAEHPAVSPLLPVIESLNS